jgi:hypothetical protein
LLYTPRNNHTTTFTQFNPSIHIVGKMAHKTSAAADEPIEVLFALQDNFNLLDFTGPLEALTHSKHSISDDSMFFSLHAYESTGLQVYMPSVMLRVTEL